MDRQEIKLATELLEQLDITRAAIRQLELDRSGTIDVMSDGEELLLPKLMQDDLWVMEKLVAVREALVKRLADMDVQP